MGKKDAARQAMRDKIRQKAKEGVAGKAGGSALLQLKKQVPNFKEKVSTRYQLILVPFEVTISNHPDGIAPGNLWYKMPYSMHWVNEKPYVCPGTFGKKCPVCAYYAQLMKDGDKEAAMAIKKKDKVFYNVVPVGDKTHKEELHLWDISWWNFQTLLDDRLEDGPDEWLDFMFPEGGKIISVKFKAEKVGTGQPFPQASQIDFLDREDLDDDLLERAVPLDTALKVLSYEALEKILYMEEDSAEEAADEDEAPPQKPERKKKPAHAPEPEEDDEDEDDPPPPPKKKQKPAPEPEPDEDDEDETPPPPKRKPKPAPEPEEDDEDEDPPAKPAKKADKKDEKKKGKSCPHGHTFGKDCDDFPGDCDECGIWEACDGAA